MLINLAYMCNNVSLPFSEKKQMVFLMLVAVTRMVIWMLQMEGILRYEHYFHQALIGFFQHQPKVKIRTDRKHLISTDFS